MQPSTLKIKEGDIDKRRQKFKDILKQVKVANKGNNYALRLTP
jgi:hypothetical protein